MAHYRVRAGRVLPHHGKVLEAGALVSLPLSLGRDPEIASRVDLIDEIEDPPNNIGGDPQQYKAIPVVLGEAIPLEPAPTPPHDDDLTMVPVADFEADLSQPSAPAPRARVQKE